jgi:hypothetical protein
MVGGSTDNDDLQPVASSVDELLAHATRRTQLAHGDGKSGVGLERVEIDARPYVVKHLRRSADWLMRATGDLIPRNVTLWRSGWLRRMPDCIDHTMVGAAWHHAAGGPGGAILMRDVGEWLLPEGDAEIPLVQHLRFLDHLAQMHVAFWDCDDPIGLLDVTTRYLCFGPWLAETEIARGGDHPVPTRFVPEGWRRFWSRAPRSAAILSSLFDDPTPLIVALEQTPRTLVHGDCKAGNLGSHADGRTILIDWAFPGVGPPCSDLAWYLCLNRARLPQPKDDAIDAYRDALERHGIATEPWWDRQLGLCLVGALLQFGWEKALGDRDEDVAELEWWDTRAARGWQHTR